MDILANPDAANSGEDALKADDATKDVAEDLDAIAAGDAVKTTAEDTVTSDHGIESYSLTAGEL